MLERIRHRLTLGYAAIFALILAFLSVVAVAGFASEMTVQQDDLLTQEARNQATNLLNGEDREVLAEGSTEFSWVALNLDGRITASDPVAASLGLPDPALARETLEKDGVVSATIRGQNGNVRAVSMPMYDGGEVVGTIQYARSLEEVRKTVRGLVLVLLPLAFGGLGLAALGGLYMSSRAMRPVKESFERQRTFIADASHELKTPLTLIRADGEVVLYRGDVNPADRKLIEHALAETERMDSVLSSLLLAARLDAGQLRVSREPFDLSVVLAETVERFGARAVSEGITLEVSAPDGLTARGDPEKTGQVLAALLDNALRFTPAEGTIAVVARSDGNRIGVTVADTGPGIAPKHLPRIFDRFYRASAARPRGGTGLGLAIARDLVRAQGGDLSARNAESGGAQFCLEVPKD